MDVICIGEMLVDFTPAKEAYTYKANPGGALANVAVSVSRNGLKADFIGRLGNDDIGRMLAKTLEDNDVKLLCPKLTDKANTTLAFVTLREDGERSFTFVRKPGADLLLSKADVKKEDLADAKLLNAGSVGMSGESSADAVVYAMRTAHELGKPVGFDINYRANIWSFKECKAQVERVLDYIDLLKISDEETDFVGGQENIPDFMKEHDIKAVILTLGADGARYYLKEEDGSVISGHIKGIKVDAVDATGAGDAFWGTLLAKLLSDGVEKASDINHELIKNAVLYGNVSGALCVQKTGGIPAIPTLDEIEDFLKKLKSEN